MWLSRWPVQYFIKFVRHEFSFVVKAFASVVATGIIVLAPSHTGGEEKCAIKKRRARLPHAADAYSLSALQAGKPREPTGVRVQWVTLSFPPANGP